MIDSHVHLYPPEVNQDPVAWAAAHREPRWAQMCARRRADGRWVQGFPTVDTLLRAMDAAGVSRAVLLGWSWENHDTCVSQNRFFATGVRAHPDRLSAFAAVLPKAGAEALSEVRRARDDGLVGIGELCPHHAGLTGASPEVAAVLALAAELRLPVNLHVTDPSTAAYPGRVETPLEDFVQMARAHPRTMFILAHWAGGLDVRAFDNVCVDTAASPLIYRSPAWARIGVTARPDQVLFGSDYPLNLYPGINDEPDLETFVAEATSALPDAATRSAVLGGNARRVLSLQA